MKNEHLNIRIGDLIQLKIVRGDKFNIHYAGSIVLIYNKTQHETNEVSVSFYNLTENKFGIMFSKYVNYKYIRFISRANL